MFAVLQSAAPSRSDYTDTKKNTRTLEFPVDTKVLRENITTAFQRLEKLRANVATEFKAPGTTPERKQILKEINTELNKINPIWQNAQQRFNAKNFHSAEEACEQVNTLLAAALNRFEEELDYIGTSPRGRTNEPEFEALERSSGFVPEAVPNPLDAPAPFSWDGYRRPGSIMDGVDEEIADLRAGGSPQPEEPVRRAPVRRPAPVQERRPFRHDKTIIAPPTARPVARPVEVAPAPSAPRRMVAPPVKLPWWKKILGEIKDEKSRRQGNK